MRNRLAALLMALILLVYLVLVVQRAVLLIASGSGVGIAMGVALIILPFIAAWAIGRELLFGARTEKLVKLMAAEGTLPVEDLPHRASGRPLRPPCEPR